MTSNVYLVVSQTCSWLITCLLPINWVAGCRFWTWQLWLLLLLSNCLNLLSECRCGITLIIRPDIRWPRVIRYYTDFTFNNFIEWLFCNKIRLILSSGYLFNSQVLFLEQLKTSATYNLLTSLTLSTDSLILSVILFSKAFKLLLSSY